MQHRLMNYCSLVQKMAHSMLSFPLNFKWVLIKNPLCEIVHFHKDQRPILFYGFAP